MSINQTVATFLEQSQDFQHHVHKIYKPLDTSKGEIRVFCIKPGYDPEPVSMTFEIMSLKDRHHAPYEAISYTWGKLSQETAQAVYLDGHEYKVNLNQWSVLRYMRDRNKARRFWMDVICINQGDVDERGQQVSIMADIYRHSQGTQIWLGDPDSFSFRLYNNTTDFLKTFQDELQVLQSREAPRIPSWVRNMQVSPGILIEGAINILRLLSEGKHLHEMPFWKYDSKGRVQFQDWGWFDAFSALATILSCPWWQRIWTVQEAIFSRETPVIHIGIIQEPLSTFTKARENWAKHCASDYSCCAALRICWGGPYTMAFVNAQAGIAELSSTAAKHRAGDGTLPMRLTLRSMRQATDPRDYAYAVQGLAPDGGPRLKLDYRQNIAEVFARNTDLAARLGLELLPPIQCYGLQTLNEYNLPSWARDIAAIHQKATTPYYPFDEDDYSHQCEKLDRSLISVGSSHRTLSIPARQLDTIKLVMKIDAIGSECISLDRLRLFQKLHGVITKSGAQVSETRLWRVLLRGWHRHISGTMSLIEAIEAWNHCQKCKPKNACMNHTGLTVQLRESTESARLFIATSGAVGIGRTEIQSGDRIFHVMQNAIPMVCRMMHGRNNDFEVVGPTYIGEYMRRERLNLGSKDVITLH